MDLLQKSECGFVALYEDIRKNEPDKFHRSECNLHFPVLSLGLHLGLVVGTSLSIVLAIMVLVVQIIFSRFWFNYHKQGPLEYLWHKLTWIE